jgi:hypothetical protein
MACQQFPPLISCGTGDPTKLGTEHRRAGAKKRTAATCQSQLTGAQITMSNREDITENLQGLRENGSSLNRTIDLHEAEACGGDHETRHVNADHNSMIEWYHEDVSDSHTFYLMGWWQ